MCVFNVLITLSCEELVCQIADQVEVTCSIEQPRIILLVTVVNLM